MEIRWRSAQGCGGHSLEIDLLMWKKDDYHFFIELYGYMFLFSLQNNGIDITFEKRAAFHQNYNRPSIM